METISFITPLFLLIGLGYGLKKLGFLSDCFITDLNHFLYNLALPALLFNSVRSIDFRAGGFGLGAIAYLCAVVFILAVAIFLSRRMKPAERGAFLQVSYRSNLAYLGLPLTTAAVGPDSIAVSAGMVTMGILIHSILTIFVLSLLDSRSRTVNLREWLAGIAKNPLILSAVLGITVSLLPWSLPRVIGDVFDLLGRVSLPMVLIIVGYALSLRKLHVSFRYSFVVLALKLFLMPAFTFSLLRFVFHAGPAAVVTGTLMAGMPTAVVSQSFARAFNADEEITSAAISITILGLAVTFPLWTLFLSGL